MTGLGPVTAAPPRFGVGPVTGGGVGGAVPPRRAALRVAGGFFEVLRGAVAVLAGHWPVLFALAFAAQAGRGLLMDGAVRLSKVNGLLGFLVVVLVPITTLCGYVLMLRCARLSLPRLRAATVADPWPGARGAFDHVGSVLLPFLAVYASYGYLKADSSEYVYQVVVDETLNNADSITNPQSVDVASRLPFTYSVVFVIVVVAAVLLRFLLDRSKLIKRRPWTGIFGAYLEVVWITLAAWFIQYLQGTGLDWLHQRRVVAWLGHALSSVQARIGLGSGDGGGFGLGTVLSWAHTVFLVPLAWLAVGAVVYGHRLVPPPRPRSSGVVRKAIVRWRVLPPVVRRAGEDLTGNLRDKFVPLWHGLRTLGRAGLPAMLLFCLVFLVAPWTGNGLWELERLLIGPRELAGMWMPLSGVLSVVNDATTAVVLVCLLAAAVDRVLAAPGVLRPSTRPGSPAAIAAPAQPAQPIGDTQPIALAQPVQVGSVRVGSGEVTPVRVGPGPVGSVQVTPGPVGPVQVTQAGAAVRTGDSASPAAPGRPPVAPRPA